jgi:AcrR family transcriptional regulator
MSSELSKRSILLAAVEAFSTRGFDSVSLRDIATVANVNHAIIRYHYGSKEALWMAVFQHLMKETAELRNTTTFNKNAKDIKAEFRNFVKSRVTHLSEHPQLLKIILLELIEGGPRFEKIDTMMRMFFLGSMEIISEMQEVGIARDLSIKDLFFIMPSLLGGRFIYPNFDKDFDGNPISAEDAIEAHTVLIMKMIYRKV